MVDLQVRGADDIDHLVKAIRTHADAKAIRKELYGGLNRVSKEVRGELIEVIPAALPRRGGLAALMEGATTSRTTAKSGRWAGVSMRFQTKGHDIRVLTGQRLRHPVYGHRGTWVTQTAGLEPSVFMARFDQQKPKIQDAVLRVLNDVARKVAQ